MTDAPTTSRLIGHHTQWEYLQRTLQAGTNVQAYLFFGPAHIGKQAMAVQFGRALLCSSMTQRPCGTCSNCLQAERGTHPDFLQLARDPEKKQIGVEEVRERIIHPMQLTSFLGQAKVAIIDQAHELGLEAANALLKTLEEPPANSYLILTTDAPDQLPDTIRSRCQQCEFSTLPQAELEQYIMEIQPQLDRVTSQQIAALARGRPGLAARYAQHPESLSELINGQRESVSVLLQPIWRRLEFINQKIGGETFQQSQASGQQLIEHWISSLRDVMCLQRGSKNSISNRFIEDELTRLSEQLSHRQTTRLLRTLLKAKKALTQNAQAKLQLENFILEF